MKNSLEESWLQPPSKIFDRWQCSINLFWEGLSLFFIHTSECGEICYLYLCIVPQVSSNSSNLLLFGTLGLLWFKYFFYSFSFIKHTHSVNFLFFLSKKVLSYTMTLLECRIHNFWWNVSCSEIPNTCTMF